MASSVCSGVVPPHQLLSSATSSGPTRSSTTLDAYLHADALHRRMGYKYVQTPTDQDILFGAETNATTGTRRYFEKIQECRPSFWMARSSKRLVEEIRVELTEEGRRFLQQLQSGSDQYVELSRNTARKRIVQDLTDDRTERKSNKRVNPPNHDNRGVSTEGASSKTKSMDEMDERSTKRTKYETAEVGSVAASAYTNDSTHGSYSEGTLSFHILPSYPTLFPYDIPTGASHHGWQSHGSCSTLNTLEMDLSGIAHLMEPVIAVDYSVSAIANLEPLALKDFESAGNKSNNNNNMSLSSRPSSSTLATLPNQLDDNDNYNNHLEDMMHQPIVEIGYSPAARQRLLPQPEEGPLQSSLEQRTATAAQLDAKCIGSDRRLSLGTRSMTLAVSMALDADVDAIQLDQTLGYLPRQNSPDTGSDVSS